MSTAEARRRGKLGGRPPKPKASAVELALLRENLGPHVDRTIERLAELRDSENEGVALRACTAILDRVYGSPTQTVERVESPAIEVSNIDAEIERLLREK